MGKMYSSFKRAFDLSLATILLIGLSPIFLVASLSIYLTMGRPVLFKQERLGWKETKFFIFKFRSMANLRNADGELLPDIERLTKLGSFIRKTSIDELPQFFNVLNGDMSLIGPRPLYVEYRNFYTEREKKRHNVRPGITGLAQVNGRNNLSWNDRLEMDVVYVENISFILDLKIFLKTIKNVLSKKDLLVVPGMAQGKLSEVRRKNMHV